MVEQDAQLKYRNIGCMHPDDIEKKEGKYPCHIPEELKPLLDEMSKSDWLEIYHYRTKVVIDGGIEVTPFIQGENLQILFSKERIRFVEEGTIPEKPVQDFFVWWYIEFSDDQENTKYANINFSDKKIDEEYTDYLNALKSKLTESEQSQARKKALDWLESLILLRDFSEEYEEIGELWEQFLKDNPKLEDIINNKINDLIRTVKPWKADIFSNSKTGDWWILGGVIQGNWRGSVTTYRENGPVKPTKQARVKKQEEGELPEYETEYTQEILTKGLGKRKVIEAGARTSIVLHISRDTHKLIPNKLTRKFKPPRVHFIHSLPKDENDSPEQVLEVEDPKSSNTSELEKMITHFKEISNQAIKPITIILRGYTDISGSPSYNNQKLSEIRANFVKKQLNEKGITNENVETQTHGCAQKYASKEQRKHLGSRLVVASIKQEK